MASLADEHIADRIMKLLVSTGDWFGDDQLAKQLNVQREVVDRWLIAIHNHDPDWTKIIEGYGDNKYQIRIMIDPHEDVEYKRFLLNGGFTRLFETAHKEKQQEEEKRNMEITKLRLEIESLKIQPWVIWANIILSICAIIISIFALKK